MISVDCGFQNMVSQQSGPYKHLHLSVIYTYLSVFPSSFHLDKGSMEKNLKTSFTYLKLYEDFSPFPSKNVLNVIWKLSRVGLFSQEDALKSYPKTNLTINYL